MSTRLVAPACRVCRCTLAAAHPDHRPVLHGLRIANSHGSHMALHQQQQQQQASAAAASQQLHHQQAQHPAALQTSPSTASSGQLPAPSASGGHSQHLAHAESGGVQSSSGGASGDVDMPMAESGPDFGSPGNPIVVQVPEQVGPSVSRPVCNHMLQPKGRSQHSRPDHGVLAAAA